LAQEYALLHIDLCLLCEMTRFFALLLIVFVCFQQANSQNLLSDGSFETLDSTCPYDQAINWSAVWNNVSVGSPDLFDTCNGVPSNSVGWQMPRTGTAYAGLVTYGRNGFREYIQSPLTSPMQDAKTYCIEFYISLSDYSPRASWAPQLYFSAAPFSVNHDTVLTLVPQWQDTSFLSYDTANWVKVSGIFNCLGNYNYVTVGNFYNNRRTNSPPTPGPLFNAYYYIDDMSITECNPAGIKTQNALSNPKPTQNPVTDWLTLEWGQHLKNASLSIFDSQGNVVPVKSFCSDTQIKAETHSLKPGLYFYLIKTDDKRSVGRFVKN
jgi:hypothetical protein